MLSTFSSKILKRYKKIVAYLDVSLIECIEENYSSNINNYEKSHNRKRWKWGGKSNSWDIERKDVDNLIEVFTLQSKYTFKHARNFTKSLCVTYDGESLNMKIPLEGKKIEMSYSAILINDHCLYYYSSCNYQRCSETLGLSLVNVKTAKFSYTPEEVSEILLNYDLNLL